MNNLKFRAWHIEQKKYYEVGGMSFAYNTVTLIIYEGNTFIQKIFEMDEVIIEQYTGLKDKNGVEIYVGDTVRYDRNIGLTIDGYRFVVAYEEGQVFLDHKFSECKNIDWDLVTIVGNIHENKELLNGL